MDHDALLPSLPRRIHLVERFAARPGAYAAPNGEPAARDDDSTTRSPGRSSARTHARLEVPA